MGQTRPTEPPVSGSASFLAEDWQRMEWRHMRGWHAKHPEPMLFVPEPAMPESRVDGNSADALTIAAFAEVLNA